MKGHENFKDVVELLDGVSSGKIGMDPDEYRSIIDKAHLKVSQKSYFYAKLSFLVSVITLIASIFIFYIDKFILKS